MKREPQVIGRDGMSARMAAIGQTLPTVACVAMLAVIGACQSIYDTVDPVFDLATPTVWAGDTILLTSDALLGDDTLPTVLVGADTAVTAFVAPDTLRLLAPDVPGWYIIRVSLRRGRGPIPVGEVSVQGGYRGWQEVAAIGGLPIPWPGPGLPSFLIAASAGLARVDPRSRSRSIQLPDSVFSIWCINGPGPATGGRIAVQGRRASGCGPLVAVRPEDPSLAPDTGPSIGAGYRFAVQLGPTRWLAAYHHGVASFFRDGNGLWQLRSDYWDELEEPQGVAVSPRADRAIVICRAGGALGIPVFTPASPDPAYWLPQYRLVRTAQFSDDGDTLFVVADTGASGPPVLAALRASDGAVLRSASAWPLTWNLVLDRGRPWLFLVHDPGDGGPAVQVVERATFAAVATLSFPAGAVPPHDAGDLFPMLSAAERRLYLVPTCSFCSASVVRIIEFDLMR